MANKDGQGPAKRARTAEDIVSFPGEEGSLAHIAATQFFDSVPHITIKGVSSFAETFRAVSAGESLYGVIPIENSSSGTVLSVYDLLLEHSVTIVGELGVREVYCLCVRPGTVLADVGRVLSHPNIIEACSTYMTNRLPRKATDAAFELTAMRSTVCAVRAVAESKEGDGPGVAKPAAIASREAAKRFGLTVLAEGIGNDTHLETRYIVIRPRNPGAASARPSPFPMHVQSPMRKRSAIFALKDEPSAVFKLLSCFALRGINVCKVETRPMRSHCDQAMKQVGLPMGAQLWTYSFYVDFELPLGLTQEAGDRLWEGLKEFSMWQKDLGSYPSHITRGEKKSNWADMVDLMCKG